MEDGVYHLRTEHGWGPDKISKYMKKKGVLLGQPSVYRILKKKGVNGPLEKPRKRLK
jgi:hypothetical protein